MDSLPDSQPRQLKIVAIGASAGGLESLERFFDGISDMASTAFVVIQHLSPNYETLMDQLLARHTSMPVSIVTDGMAIEGNHVYVLPPKMEMFVEQQKLRLQDKSSGESPNFPIDLFFQSMAKSYGSSCAALVLSGTGSDGSRGCREVRHSGGLVMCESETTAKFTGMPRSAYQTGCVDFVLPPESMGEQLRRHMSGDPESLEDDADIDSDQLTEILNLIRHECHSDFRHYKTSTVSRRIDRRMSMLRVDSLGSYIELLKQSPAELHLLFEDMLIGVTTFFRDEQCFQHLASEVIPQLIANSTAERGMRVWVAGCATGEEAYSLAILIDEVRTQLGKTEIPFKIFASDIHSSFLNTASSGIYPLESVTGVSEARLKKYFTQQDDHYVVIPELRRTIVFTPHNVLQDPPFTDLDLVSCRNLLIYFDSAAQRKSLTLFHFGLRKGGFLFLGPSETIGTLRNEFHVENERCRIYSKQRDSRLPENLRLPIALTPQAVVTGPSRTGQQRNELASQLDTYERLLNAVMPPTLLVDSNRKIVETFGGSEQILRFPPRNFTNDLLDVAPPDLRTPLSAVFRRVIKSGQPIRLPVTDVSLHGSQEVSDIDIVAHPLEPRDGSIDLVAIQITVAPSRSRSFLEDAVSAEELKLSGGDAGLRERMTELEDELRHSKENLQATIEELETSNEELQATNEELIASNEELQSTNEELNSVNEELHTVNVEYQNKNSELRELNEDMNHLFSSTDIGTIILDRSLAIRRFTPRIANIFNLEPNDIGRQLAAFSHTLKLENLHELVNETLTTAEINEFEVTDKFENHYFLRILPYVVEGNVAGVVITLTDISSLKEAKELAAKYQRRLQRAIDAVPVFVSFVNAERRYEYVNKAYYTIMGKDPETVIGQSIEELIGPESYQVLRPHVDRALEGEPQLFEFEMESKKGKIYLSVSYTPSISKSGNVHGFYVAAADITQAKKAERALEKAARVAAAANEAKSDFLAKMSHEIRSPMTAILGFADILDNQLKQPDNRDCVDVIRKNGHHLLELINDILDLSRVESGKLELAERTFNPADMIRGCYNTVAPKAESAGTSIAIDISDEADEPMLGDRRRLRQVVLNLLSNAVKFCEGGNIQVTAERENDQLAISVIDDGCGIDEERLPELFEPFSQLDNSDTRKFEGSGLGLAITKQLVDCMKGTISVASKLGVGSTFTVKIPWRDGSGDVEGETVELAAPGPRLDNKWIVVIDDRRDVRFIAEHILRDAGATVSTAENGHEGIAIVEQSQQQHRLPNCIVSDIQMPEMDGYETARRLREIGFKRPILALTASAMKAEQEKCMQAGCNAHLPKPINKSAFVQTIADLIADSEENGE